jgi:hypothetical protein
MSKEERKAEERATVEKIKEAITNKVQGPPIVVRLHEHKDGQYSVGAEPFEWLVCKDRETADKWLEEFKLVVAPRPVKWVVIPHYA